MSDFTVKERLNLNGGDDSVPLRKLCGEAYEEIDRLERENAALREALGALVNRTKNIGQSKFGARANYEAFLDAWMAARELLKSQSAQDSSEPE